jgi:hypothetical protein
MMAKLMDALDERINPIVVKQMHQGLRSRWLTLGIALSLFGLLATYATTAALVEMSDGVSGRTYFSFIIAAGILMAWLVLPITGSRQLAGEISSRTLELILLTRLSAWQNISGRFQANLVKLTLVLSLSAPFSVAAVLMGGIGVDHVFAALLLILLLGVAAQSLGLLAGSLCVIGPKLGVLALIAYLGALMTLCSGGIAMLAEAQLVTRLGWEGTAWLSLCTAGATLFCLRLAADLLLPAGVRAFVGSKLALIGFLGALCLPAIVGNDRSGAPIDRDLVVGVLAMAVSGLYLVCSFWSAVPPPSTPARHRWRGRILPLQNGYEGTLGYLLLTSLLATVLTTVHALPPFALIVFGYFLAFSGVATGVAHAFGAPASRPTRYLVLLIALALANAWLGAMDLDAAGSAQNNALSTVFFPLRLADRWRHFQQPLMLGLPPLFGLMGAVFARLVRNSEARPKGGLNNGT